MPPVRRLGLIALVLVACLPADAVAHDTYVDHTDGADTGNDCRHKSNPCATIGRGISQAGDGDTIYVGGDPDPFTVPHDLGDGKSLVKKNYSDDPGVDTSGSATIDTGSDPDPAITVDSKAGRLKGFTIRSQTLPLQINAPVTVSKNRFDESAALDEEVNLSCCGTGKVKLDHNTFVDPTPLTGSGDMQRAILDFWRGASTISHNEFVDFYKALDIEALTGDVTIEDNEFSGAHGVDGFGADSIAVISAGKVSVVENELRDPDLSVGSHSVTGISLLTKGTVSRNRVSGYHVGLAVSEVSGRTEMESDAVVIPDADAYGALISDYDDPDPGTDLDASNLTIWGPGEAIELQKVQIKLDSSILGGEGIVTFYGDNDCSIKYSRGPEKGGGDSGCKDFDTTKGPGLKNDDIHLEHSSPMIDEGNKDDPGKHAKDVDGDKRAIACGKGKPRRDIGADEFDC